MAYAHPLKTPDPTQYQELSGNAHGLSYNADECDDDGNAACDNASGEQDDIERELAAQQQQQINDEELREMCVPLEIDNRCNLCAIASICLQRDRNKEWLLDYSLLCYKCNSAPRTPMSTLVVAIEFIELMGIHFPAIDRKNLFSQNILTVFDFHMHFFINRCFTKQSDNLVASENITLQHVAVVKSVLLGDEMVPYSKHQRISSKKIVKNDNKDIKEETPFQKYTAITDHRFDEVMFFIWSGTNVFCGITISNLAIQKHNAVLSTTRRFQEVQFCVGPVYLSPTPIFVAKNQTTTVCLLCELMACSYDNNIILRKIKDQIVGYCHNNLKLIDRIQLTLVDVMSGFKPPAGAECKSRDISSYVTREYLSKHARNAPENATLNLATYFVLRQVGIVGLYKHFFCDPQCAANIRCTDPNILFGVIDTRHIRETKLSICCDNNYISHVDRKTWLYIQTFKAFQVTKRNYRAKTQLSDFLREFRQVLEAGDIHLVDPCFVVDKYV